MIAGRLQARVGKVRLGLYDDGQTIQLANDELFVIGDNLTMSKDSRIFGPIKLADVIGITDFKYWPIQRIGLLH